MKTIHSNMKPEAMVDIAALQFKAEGRFRTYCTVYPQSLLVAMATSSLFNYYMWFKNLNIDRKHPTWVFSENTSFSGKSLSGKSQVVTRDPHFENPALESKVVIPLRVSFFTFTGVTCLLSRALSFSACALFASSLFLRADLTGSANIRTSLGKEERTCNAPVLILAHWPSALPNSSVLEIL